MSVKMKHNPRASSLPDKGLGEKIRARRIQAGVSQSQLGEALGISFQQIQKYEKGSNRVSVARLEQIAKALGEGIGYFMGPCDVSKAGQEMQALIADPINQRMLRIFAAIPSISLRYKIVQLVEQMWEEID